MANSNLIGSYSPNSDKRHEDYRRKGRVRDINFVVIFNKVEINVRKVLEIGSAMKESICLVDKMLIPIGVIDVTEIIDCQREEKNDYWEYFFHAFLLYNLFKMVYRARKLLLLSLLSLYVFIYLTYLNIDSVEIMRKDLHGHDGSSNAVVSSNIYRKFFPVMLRINPLKETGEEKEWMLNAYWQHIPPLFAYVPLPFFVLDGGVTIEGLKLSYSMVNFLTGLLFIVFSYFYTRKLTVVFGALIASSLFISNNFTRALVIGNEFGRSDIFLAFTVVLAYGAILWYLSERREDRINYKSWKLLVLGVAVSLPILAKNALGAIAPSLFFAIFFADNIIVWNKSKRFNRKIFYPLISFGVLIYYYYFSLYITSPITFKQEFLTSIKHVGDYEGWGRPWDFYFTNYFPFNYKLPGWGVLIAIILVWHIFLKEKLKNRSVKLLYLCLLWFLWNLLVVTLISSKSPNFIFQSYLFFVFAAVYGVFYVGEKVRSKLPLKSERLKLIIFVFIGLFLMVFCIGGSIFKARDFAERFDQSRKYYYYRPGREKFYQIAEYGKKKGWDTRDLVLIKTGNEDYWFCYYFIFVTGAETREFGQFLDIAREYEGNFYSEVLKEKYRNIILILDKEDNHFEGIEKFAKVERPVFLDFMIASFNLKNTDENILNYLMKGQ